MSLTALQKRLAYNFRDEKLLALALTPIILTAGIDLSVGSLLGLCAIIFGKLWHDGGLSIQLAATLTLFAGALGGGLNAALVFGAVEG